MGRLVDFLRLTALEIPEKTAVICRGERVTYGELWQRVTDRASALAPLPRRTLVVRAAQDIDFIVTYFAAHLAGKVMVPLEHDAPDAAFESVSDTVDANEIPEEVADILFTTGTTGQSKGTMISHEAIVADAENLIDAQGFARDLTFIVCGPLNHIGSLSKIWPSVIVGATIHVLEGIKDMDAFFTSIRDAQTKVATFLVPASIRMVLHFGDRQLGECLDRIDFIETGAAPISQADMEALCRLLPHTRLYNTYASTETGIICTHNYNDGYCVAGCLGRPMRHSILRIDDEGMISCQGATLMSGYIGDPLTTAQVLHDGAVFTNDKGVLDEEGRLQLTGRVGDIINIGGYKINPVEVEDAAKACPLVDDCICIADSHPVLGTALRLLVVTKEGMALDKKALGKVLMDRLEMHKVPQMVTEVDSIRRTYNGKLDRKSYRNAH